MLRMQLLRNEQESKEAPASTNPATPQRAGMGLHLINQLHSMKAAMSQVSN